MTNNTKVPLDEAALQIADMAWVETFDSSARRTRAAVDAYLWAIRNIRPIAPGSDIMVYPSLEEWRVYAHATPEETA